ncbi:MAG: helix-turn-helix domain-containing protein [Lachnospiraceae bacterium]|jgi:transcriptional regulator with XRE-family HTH domain
MRTSLGRILRNLRLDNNQILKDMADVLEVSSAFLSAVENGKKKMPDDWVDKLAVEYHLDDDQKEGLRNAAMESQKTISLDISGASPVAKQLAVSFARNFNDMDENTTKKLMNILKNKERRGKSSD